MFVSCLLVAVKEIKYCRMRSPILARAPNYREILIAATQSLSNKMQPDISIMLYTLLNF